MSREELEKRILEARYNLVSSKDKETIDILEELAIKALEQEPCIEPLERLAESVSKTAKALERLKEQEPMLDKIRAEIEDLDRFYDSDYFSGNRDSMFKCNEVMQILDKYRKEQE